MSVSWVFQDQKKKSVYVVTCWLQLGHLAWELGAAQVLWDWVFVSSTQPHT